MRPLLLLASGVFAACGPPSAPPPQAQAASTSERWYGQTVDELAALDREAKDLVKQHKSDDAAALIVKGEPLSTRLLSVPQPTLEATIAASDLDDLYGRMLLSNRNYGWARLLFQKNLARWKYWKPRTPETESRRKQAESAIAECDSHMARESATGQR